MTGFLRFVGLMNAAIWLGGSVFFTLVAGSVPFSPDMKELLARLGPANATFSTYLAGAIAQIGIAKFFTFQLVCGAVALAHLAAEWLYQERSGRKALIWLVLALLGLSLVGDFGLLPKLRRLHAVKYAQNYPPAQREAAARSFGMWHGISMTLNLFMLGGLVVHLLNMSRPPEPARFVRAGQFRS